MQIHLRGAVKGTQKEAKTDLTRYIDQLDGAENFSLIDQQRKSYLSFRHSFTPISYDKCNKLQRVRKRILNFFRNTMRHNHINWVMQLMDKKQSLEAKIKSFISWTIRIATFKKSCRKYLHLVLVPFIRIAYKRKTHICDFLHFV